MTITLERAAVLAQVAARETVRAAMEARGRNSPYETTEAWLKIAILERLLSEIRTLPNPHLRLFDEFTVNGVTNLDFGPEVAKSHPIDLVVLHPLKAEEHPWDSGTVLGLIEIKRHHGRVEEDAAFLAQARLKASGDNPDAWALAVVLITGSSAEIVRENAAIVGRTFERYGLESLVAVAPEPAPQGYGGEHRWFDIGCWGRALQVVTS